VAQSKISQMIQRIFLFTLSIVLITACGQNKKGISGTIDGAENEVIYFEKYVDNKPQPADSTTIDSEGNFYIDGTDDLVMDYYRLSLGEEKSMILLMDSTESVYIESDVENFGVPTKVKGSKNTKLLRDFNQKMTDFVDRTDSLQKVFQDPNTSNEMKAQIKSNYTEIISEKNEFARQYIDNNLDKPASLSGLAQLNLDTDMEYYEKVQDALKDNFGHSFYYKMIGTQVESYKKKKKLAESGQVQRPEKNSKYKEGMIAPNIKMEGPNGKTRELKDLRGKVVLIDFWASWCKPCRRENPNLVRTYQKYVADGFDIFSVSFDKNKDRWIQAIEKDNLTWDSHVSDLQGWQNAAGQQYEISSIPHTILIDKKGEIIATKLRGSALEQKLAEVFGH
jgi:thiol-disulfide isomerase/thioredoxin